MKIIDAHLHLFSQPWAEETAQRVGHHNSLEHLRQVYGELGVVHGVVMGNGGLDPAAYDHPADLLHYCVGLDGASLRAPDLPDRVEAHLRREDCCGVKLYPGYDRTALSDPLYGPIYELAAHYGKPVAVHMGLTAFPKAYLKDCHPLALDEAAADHPRTQFVMCHFGNPFFESAAAVLAKNPNVAADLSGLLEGRVDLNRYFREQEGYLFLLKTWMIAARAWDRLLYGTDWPIVNLEEYLHFILRLVPPTHWEEVLFGNADRVYGLGLSGGGR